jgi:hypothetical protein
MVAERSGEGCVRSFEFVALLAPDCGFPGFFDNHVSAPNDCPANGVFFTVGDLEVHRVYLFVAPAKTFVEGPQKFNGFQRLRARTGIVARRWNCRWKHIDTWRR